MFTAETVNSCMTDAVVSIRVEDNPYALWSFYSLVKVPFSVDVMSNTDTALYSRFAFTKETDEQVITRQHAMYCMLAPRPYTHTYIHPHTRTHSLK